ncbi:HD domain-containing phosphohydrolase [Vibrio ezurae]|nr:HD domain-containing phosphohydrolase [Vibrio ezurae]
MKRRFSIKVTVISLFILTTCITAGVAISLQYYFSRQQALYTALEKYQNIAYSVGTEVREFDEFITNITKVLASLEQELEQFEHNHIARNAFAQLMENSPWFYSVYLARNNGHFYQLINLDSVEALRSRIGARSEDRWALVEIKNNGQGNSKVTSYYSDTFELRESVQQKSKYNAVERPWFVGASHAEVFKTEPYLFHNIQLNGQTYASRIKNSKFGSVVGIDVVVASLAHEVKSSLGPVQTHVSAQFYIYDETGMLKASSHEEQFSLLPGVRPLSLTPSQQTVVAESDAIEISNQTDWSPLDFAVSGKPTGYFVDLMRIVSLKTGIQFKFINGLTWQEMVEAYQRGDIEVLYPMAHNAKTQSLGRLSSPLARFDFALATSDNSTVSIGDLHGKKIGILQGWSIIDEIRQEHPSIELVELEDIYIGLTQLKTGQLDAVMDLSVILQSKINRHFLEGIRVHQLKADSQLQAKNSFHFVTNRLDPKLVDIMNLAVESLTPSEIHFLENKWFGADSPSSVVPHKFLIDAIRTPSLRNKLSQFDVNGVPYFGFVQQLDLFEDGTEFLSITIPAEALLEVALSNVMTVTLSSAAILLLLIPLSHVFSNPIVKPIHALIRQTSKVRERKYSSVELVPTVIKELDELSNSIQTTADALNHYEIQQQEFVDSFIQLIAQAIDDKSPYTAGHCNRVPELAIKLVSEAENAQQGPFAQFNFANDEQRREFKIAAWLHDCGKITTPEYIVDKGSKLEVNYNRIHEIRTRFEVLIRDQIIAFYQQQSPQINPDLDAHLQASIEELKQEFSLVAKANVGGEMMDDEAIERIQQIAQKTWVRYLDNRIGLSPEEQRHLAQTYAQQKANTSGVENVLSDKPEHLIPHLHKVEFDPSFNIKMEVPEYLANQGELYNLCIRRGTLTPEDRFKINEHIISTIKMLEAMPFPEDLSKVPRYASTHHETMKGTGYPRKLKGDELTIPERILALSDVFEALTAADRPYKKSKTLSESLTIMKFMVLDEHLDKDVYRLFLQSKTYLYYAQRYLEPEQIDDVNIDDYWV